MTRVPRETASGHYTSVPRLADFAELLATRGVDRGLIGPREVPRLWSRHLVNCAVVAEEEQQHIPSGALVADVGSGAGLPGVVWALVRPDIRVTLIEPLLRRTTFLIDVVAELELGDRVSVRRSRAEDLGQERFEVVTARAVARLPQLLEWTFPLVASGGRVLALKGSSVQAEIDESSATLRRLGVEALEVRQYGKGLVDPPTTVVVATRRATGSGAGGPSKHRVVS